MIVVFFYNGIQEHLRWALEFFIFYIKASISGLNYDLKSEAELVFSHLATECKW